MAYQLSDKFWTTSPGESQFSLSQEHKDENAGRIMGIFLRLGWQMNSICAMLGNMDVESRMNPRAANTGADTYGLVQWHPASKYTNWAAAEGLNYELGTSQCKRIAYEEENNLQWQDWAVVTFSEWARTLQEPIETLTYYFMRYYEVADPGTLNERIEWALYYSQNVTPIYQFPIWIFVPVLAARKRKQLGRRKISL